MLDNETYNITWNENYTFWAHIYDDSKYNNTIISVDSLIAHNTVYQEVAPQFPLSYNCISLQCVYQGSFELNPSDDKLIGHTPVNGTLNVQMPVSLEIKIFNITDYSVVIMGVITPEGKSNFTIMNQTMMININGKDYPVNITVNEKYDGEHFYTWTIGNGTQTLDRLNAGTYTVTANYAGDKVHLAAKEAFKEFFVELHDIWIAVNASSIYAGETVRFNVTSNATNTKNGRISIRVNGIEIFKNIHLNPDGSKILEWNSSDPTYYQVLTKLGTYTVSIAFTNGSYFNYQLNYSTFDVKKSHTPIEANVSTPIFVGDALIINVTLNETANGFVKIFINGKEYVEEVIAGRVQFEIYGLPEGNYTNKTVIYVGSDVWYGNSTNITFTVNKKTEYVMDVKVDSITYGDNATIMVKVPTDATGNVTIYLNETNMGTFNVTGGSVQLVVSDLAGGDYVVNVTYNGDSKYNPRDKNNTKFKVKA